MNVLGVLLDIRHLKVIMIAFSFVGYGNGEDNLGDGGSDERAIIKFGARVTRAIASWIKSKGRPGTECRLLLLSADYLSRSDIFLHLPPSWPVCPSCSSLYTSCLVIADNDPSQSILPVSSAPPTLLVCKTPFRHLDNSISYVQFPFFVNQSTVCSLSNRDKSSLRGTTFLCSPTRPMASST